MTRGFALQVETEKFMTALNLLFLAYSLIMIIATLSVLVRQRRRVAAPGARSRRRPRGDRAGRVFPRHLEKIGNVRRASPRRAETC